MGNVNITTTFYEKVLDKEFPLVNIHYIFEGNPIDFAKDLCFWLIDKEITIANLNEDSVDVANGYGCLVAQYVKCFKRGFGSMYITPFDKSFYKHSKFNYHVIIDGDMSKLPCNANEITTIKMTKYGGNVLFTGTPKELLDYISKLDKKHEEIEANKFVEPTYDELLGMMDDYILELKKLAKTEPQKAKDMALQSLIATGMWSADGSYIGLEKLNV